jgi:hypothetical protein
MPRMSPRVSIAARLLAGAVVAAALIAAPASAQVADTFAPEITITVPSEGQVFASNQGNIPTAFSCQDEPGGSGLAPGGCAGPASIDTTQLGEQIFTVTGTDLAGNSAPKLVHYRVVDMIAPQITITAPTPNQHFPLHSTQDATFDCTDAGGSGIDTCHGDQNPDTSELGSHVFTVLAIDRDGNRTTMSVPYVVDPVLEFDPDLDHNSQAVLNAAVPALKRLAHASSATISVHGARPGSRVAVRVTGRRGVTVAKGSGRVGADAAVRFKLRAAGKKARRLLRGRLKVFVTVTGTDGRVSRRNRVVSVRR